MRGCAHFMNMEVMPEAEPPRMMFVADSSMLCEWPSTIPKNPVSKINPPRHVRGVECPKNNTFSKKRNLLHVQKCCVYHVRENVIDAF